MHRPVERATAPSITIDATALDRRLERLTAGLRWPVAGVDCAWSLGWPEGGDVEWREREDGQLEAWPNVGVEVFAAMLGIELGDGDADAHEEGHNP